MSAVIGADLASKVNNAKFTAEQVRVNRETVAPNTRRGGDIRVTLSPKSVHSCSGFGGILHLPVGDYITEHFHPYSEEFIHVVSGDLEMILNGEPIALGAGDSLLVPIGVRHRLVNTGSVDAHVVFHLSPLAPSPEFGHVDTEEAQRPELANPDVGGHP